MLASRRNIYQNMVSKFELRDTANISIDTYRTLNQKDGLYVKVSLALS